MERFLAKGDIFWSDSREIKVVNRQDVLGCKRKLKQDEETLLVAVLHPWPHGQLSSASLPASFGPPDPAEAPAPC